ncbi:MAG: MerR family transcriptional regulator [Methylococcaceae bacterium]|nr:MerR family transcriptional regulator [Methylococcaceae bacterium]
MEQEFGITELCTLADLSARTVRFYIQQGLVSRPTGEKKGAKYNKSHLDQLLSIKKWQAAGLSLERIRELLDDPDSNDVPLRPKWSGMVEVWSHLHIADGVELHIEPNRAGLAPEELRAFLRQVMEAYTTLTEEKQ